MPRDIFADPSEQPLRQRLDIPVELLQLLSIHQTQIAAADFADWNCFATCHGDVSRSQKKPAVAGDLFVDRSIRRLPIILILR
jgi:hypothetical protein